MDLKDEIRAMAEGSSEELEDAQLDFGEHDGKEGEEGEEAGEAEGSAEAGGEEVADEDKELSIEERYKILLEEHNRQSSVLLDIINQQAATDSRQRSPIGEIQGTQPPAQVVEPKFSINKEDIQKAVLEGDADALYGILDKLASFVSERLTDQREQLKERVLLELPTVAREVARNEFALFSAVKEFYNENKDLIPYQFIVGAVTNELASKEPQLSIPDLLVKVETETRKRLGLKKQIQEREIAGNRGAPAFGKPRNVRRLGPPKTESLRDDIEAMMKAKW